MQENLLFQAAKEGRLDEVKVLVQQGEDVNCSNCKGTTPLRIACENGHEQMVRFLICEGAADANKPNERGSTPLMWVSANGSLNIVKLLVEQGKANVNSIAKDGSSAVWSASQADQLDVVKFLVKSGANINQQSNSGQTPVYRAVDKKLIAMVKFLVDQNADLSLATNAGKTPLHLAVGRHEQLVSILCDGGSPIEASDIGGFTPFLTACAEGNSQIVQTLIKKGANVMAYAWNFNNGLHLAAAKGHTDLVTWLFSHTPLNINTCNCYGSTALHLAALGGHTAVVKLLVKNGANVNIQNNNGQTAVHKAIESGKAEVASFLYNLSQSNKHAKNLLGLTPLMYADKHNPQLGKTLDAGLRESDPVDSFQCIPALKFSEVASQVLPVISLNNVKLISLKDLLNFGKFPKYDECESAGCHITAAVVKLSDKVLFVSHRWGSVELPDPTQEQYFLLKQFLEQQSIAFDYIWLDYACICQEKGSELFFAHLSNIPTAVWVSTHCIIIPKLERLANNQEEIVAATYLTDYLGRAWCVLEAMACLLTETQVFCSFKFGNGVSFEPFDRPEYATAGLGFYAAYIKAFNKLPERNSMPPGLAELWRPQEICQILGLLVHISISTDGATKLCLTNALSLNLSLEDIKNSESTDILKLWDLLGACAFEEDKVIVMRLMLFIGYYSANLHKEILKSTQNQESSENTENPAVPQTNLTSTPGALENKSKCCLLS